MIRVDDNVINLIEKIRRAIRDGKMPAEDFPMEAISSLIECTLGETFWKCVGSKSNLGFAKMPDSYKECLQDALERKDMEDCSRILQLFECSYLAFYTAMNEDEVIFRQKPYRKMIIELGMANAQMQHRLHQQRQKALPKQEEKPLAEGKGVVYTCLLGEKELHQPEEVCGGIDYLCFTDQEEKWGKQEGVWKYCPIDNSEKMSANLVKSKYMIMIHELLPEYDYSIWIAPEFMIVGDVLRFCKVYGEGNSFISFSNSKDDCIYEDLSVTHMQTDDLNIRVRKRMLQYQKEGYPEHNGLIDSRVMVRNHRDEKLHEVMKEWWEEIQNCDSFMGNMFNYVAWKHQFPFSICDLFVYENPYFVNAEIDLDTNETY